MYILTTNPAQLIIVSNNGWNEPASVFNSLVDFQGITQHDRYTPTCYFKSDTDATAILFLNHGAGICWGSLWKQWG